MLTAHISQRLRWLLPGLVAAFLLVFLAAPAAAQIDIAGEWASHTNEDQPHRVPGAELGDYTGLPVNQAARQKANEWDASILSLPEEVAEPHPAQYFMRGPGPNMRIIKVTNPVTQTLIAYTLEGVFGRDDRVIWMDGRPHPSEYAEPTWAGYSTGKIVGNQLIVTTDHMKYGRIQRNGVPSSQKGVMTETFIRHGQVLMMMSVINDPVYLEEPFVRTQSWVRSSNITPDQRFVFEPVDEVAGHPLGYVPHFPFPMVQDGYSKKHGIPLEAANGGKATLYPEYEAVLQKLIAAAAKAMPAAKGASK
jgi:hypothetical protein